MYSLATRIALGAALLTAACGLEAPRSFRAVSMDEARQLSSAGNTILVEAASPVEPPVDSSRNERVLCDPRPLPAGTDGSDEVTALVIAPRNGLGYRCAAALARSSSAEIALIVVGSDAERHELRALHESSRRALGQNLGNNQEEQSRGRDS